MRKKRIAYIKPRDGYLVLVFNQNGRQRKALGLTDTKENRKLAEAIAAKKESEIRRGMFELGKYISLSLEDAIHDFIDNKTFKNKNGRGVYESAFKSFSGFIGIDKKINEIKPKDITKWKEHIVIKSEAVIVDNKEIKPAKLRSDTTIATYNNHIKILFDYLVKKGYVKENPVSHMEGKKNLIVTIPEDDFEKIFAFFSAKKRTDQEERSEDITARQEQLRLIKFLKLTGFRAGEAVNLKWENIDYSRNLITVRNEKENRDDYVDLIPQVKDLLSPVRKPTGKIFPFTEDGLKFFPRAMKHLGMSYTLHDIRRTFGSNLANSGWLPLDLMAAMRHKDIKTTMKYYVNMEIKRIGKMISDSFNEKKRVKK